MTMRWRFQRSATMPPIGASRNTGICPAKPTTPSRSDEPVKRYTSQDCATFCIQVPISEINCPLKKSWKLRCRSERTIPRARERLSGSVLCGRDFAIGLIVRRNRRWVDFDPAMFFQAGSGQNGAIEITFLAEGPLSELVAALLQKQGLGSRPARSGDRASRGREKESLHREAWNKTSARAARGVRPVLRAPS